MCLRAHAESEAQISLRMRAVWSGPSVSSNWIIGYYSVWREEGPGGFFAHSRMIWISVFCACSKATFRLTRPNVVNCWFVSKPSFMVFEIWCTYSGIVSAGVRLENVWPSICEDCWKSPRRNNLNKQCVWLQVCTNLIAVTPGFVISLNPFIP